MAPTAGAQYHWVAGLAPVRFATIFSWAAGWITVFARISLFASSAFVAAQILQGIIVINVPGYSPVPWQGTILYWGIILLTTAVNIIGIRKLPHIETLAFIWFICMFFVYLVPLVYLTPQSTAEFVFTDFENSSGWSSDGLSWFLGLMNAAYCFVGIDGTSHMSEEVRKASTVVPRSMLAAQFINGIFGLAMTLILLFGIGDISHALSTKAKYPIIQILLDATGSVGATTAMIMFLIVILVFVSLGILASASRLTWAFARDYGLPFPKFFAAVRIFLTSFR
jgi:choline transport protein